uniref:Uncharacterized protein n=1 Tax=viral metagenome TaxID=1070528 RepID=A0A6M3IY87_9ZZZZ
MPAVRKVAITHTDLDIETFPWERVRELAELGLTRATDICAKLDIPVKAFYNKRQLDEAFRERWEQEVGVAQSTSVCDLLGMLWKKAHEGDRPAIIELLKRFDPDGASRIQGDVIQVKSDKTMIMTGQQLEDKLAQYHNDRIRIRQQIAIMEDPDARGEGSDEAIEI